MRFFLVISVLLTQLYINSAIARSPAVMDFVGVEHESFKHQRVPSGANTAYNLESKDYSSYQEQLKNVEPVNYFNFSTFISLFFILCLPFATWLTLKIKSDNQKVKTKQMGIEIISKYRKVKELAEESNENPNDDFDDISKAS